MNNAIFLGETIVGILPHHLHPYYKKILTHIQEDFDSNPSLVHELILRIADPELGHASMD
jgi:hypothetical protein